MYNLLMTFPDEDWEENHYELDKSRFLEYTNDVIAEKYKLLTPNKIQQLKSFPCLFAYEGKKLNVKIGYITSIKENGRTISIEFEIWPNISFPYSAIDRISGLLDIRSWETNRTHWALKDADLIKILKEADLLPLNFPDRTNPENEIGNPKETKNRTSTIKSVTGFIEKVLGNDEDKYETFYRGHSNKEKYKLEPSLFRKDDDGNYIHRDSEHHLYRELMISNSGDFSSDQYMLDRLVRMQHYSLPTRLLDITSNPLIALYFACKSGYGTAKYKYKDEMPGEVILISLKKDKVKYFDSDTASCIANLARLPQLEKDEIDFSLPRSDFNKQPPIGRLTHFIRAEKPFFQPNVNPEDLRQIFCVKSKKNNDRITSQSGAFLLFGIDAILDESGTSEIQVTRITVLNKRTIMKDLDQLNINDSTVFPYIENSAKYVAQKYAFNKI